MSSVGRMSTHECVCTQSVCTLSVCVSKSAPKVSGTDAEKPETDGRAANTVCLPQVNSSSTVLLLLLLLKCAKLHTHTSVSLHKCAHSVCRLRWV